MEDKHRMDAGGVELAIDTRSERERLLAEINADLPPNLDWRAGALSYVEAEITKHGREAYTRYLLCKPLSPIPADPAGYRPALQENLGYLSNFLNAFALLDLPGGSRVLDVACGSGWFAQYFARMNYDAFGFDISAGMVDLARQRFQKDPQLTDLAPDLTTRLFRLDIEGERLPERLRGTFDAVVLESCMHHFVDPISALTHLTEGLKEDGLMLVIEGENRNGPLRPEYLAVMREFATLERPYTRSQIEAVFDMSKLPHRCFLGRVNGWFCPEDPRIAALPDIVRGDANAINLAVCARTEAALRRVLPHYCTTLPMAAIREEAAGLSGSEPRGSTEHTAAVFGTSDNDPPTDRESVPNRSSGGWLARLLRRRG